MITTTHAILNTALLGRKKNPERNWPIVLGSIVPDIPMILFALLTIFTGGRFQAPGKSAFISEYHFRQLWVDWGHSIPLAMAGMLVCLFLQSKGGLYFFTAMGLHDLEDLPVHSDSPHRHFLPFSNWQFYSPISYVDPRYHAEIVAPLEWLIVLICIGILWRRNISPWVQALLLFIGIFQGFWVLFEFGSVRW